MTNLRFSRVAILLAGALSLSACVHEARMAMPSQVATSAERIEITGLGGWLRGHFKLGESEGRFSREALSARNSGFEVDAGRGHVEIDGPEVGGRVVAECGYRQAALDGGLFTVTNERLRYECVFDRDGTLAAGMRLMEVPRGRGLLAGVTRAGSLQLGEVTLGIRAVHDMAGGGLPTGTPLGYAFEIEGRQVGAIEMNGTERTVYAPRAAGPERDAVLMASLGLAVFWDPGDRD